MDFAPHAKHDTCTTEASCHRPHIFMCRQLLSSSHKPLLNQPKQRCLSRSGLQHGTKRSIPHRLQPRLTPTAPTALGRHAPTGRSNMRFCKRRANRDSTGTTWNVTACLFRNMRPLHRREVDDSHLAGVWPMYAPSLCGCIPGAKPCPD